MIKFKRGLVFWTDLDILQGKRRPAVIVSRDFINTQENKFVTVVPFSTSVNDDDETPARHLKFKINGRTTQLLPEFMTCIAKDKLVEYIGTFSDEEVEKIDKEIKVHLAYEEYIPAYNKTEVVAESKSIVNEVKSETKVVSIKKESNKNTPYRKVKAMSLSDKCKINDVYTKAVADKDSQTLSHLTKEIADGDRARLGRLMYIIRKDIEKGA